MLNVLVVAVGSNMPDWVDRVWIEYSKRLRNTVKIELREIPALKRGKNPDIGKVVQEEESRISDAVAGRDRVIALDRCGRTVSTRELAQQMTAWMQDGPRVALVIGGPEGLSTQFLETCQATWSLSAMTFAHPVARVVLAEQLYRGYSIIQGLPYHR